jgi:predicted Zn-dependent protease
VCPRCGHARRDQSSRVIDAAIESAARDRLPGWNVSRRAFLRTALGLAAWPAGQLLLACATVPVTGRSQLRLVSDAEEAQIGIAAFQQLRQQEEKQGRLLTDREDPAAHAWVKRVGLRVIEASGLQKTYQWDYMIINAPQTVNAAAIAGGRIMVYTGILPVARDDAGLATILGHEVGHVMAHHTAERLSQSELVDLAGAAAGAAGVGDFTMAVLGLGAQVGILLPYSRAQESEADHIGLLLMAKAGYDPRQSVALWQRMSQVTGGAGRGAEFLSTHPNPETRITNLQGWMPQAWQYYQNPNLALPTRQ